MKLLHACLCLVFPRCDSGQTFSVTAAQILTRAANGLGPVWKQVAKQMEALLQILKDFYVPKTTGLRKTRAHVCDVPWFAGLSTGWVRMRSVPSNKKAA